MGDTKAVGQASEKSGRPALYLCRGVACVLLMELLLLVAGAALHGGRVRTELDATYTVLNGPAAVCKGDGSQAAAFSQGLSDIMEALAPPPEGWPTDPLEALAGYQGRFFLAKEKLNRLTAYANSHALPFFAATQEGYAAMVDAFHSMELALIQAWEQAGQPHGLSRYIRRAEIYRLEAVEAAATLRKSADEK